MTRVHLALFGNPQIEVDGREVQLSLRKALAMLAYLSVTKHNHSRDLLATIFWPESDQSSARAALRRTLYRLNQALGEDVLAATPETISINPQVELTLDVDAFRDQVETCLPAAPEADLAPGCLKQLEAAAALYRDDFLAGFSLPDTSEFEEWRFFEAESLRQLLAQALVAICQADLQQGDYLEAIPFARRWLALDPLHEPAHCLLMQLYAWSGQQAAALRQYRECANLLGEQLGVEPAPKTRMIYEAIQARNYPAPTTSSGTANLTEIAISPAEKEPKFMPPHTKYVQSGEIHIAYQVLGTGPPDVVFISGFVSNLDLIWNEPELVAFFRTLASQCRLILFDKRGVGLSDRIGYPPTLDHTIDDIRAILKDVGVERPVIMGVSEGGPTSILFAASYPEQVAGLVLYGTMPRFTRTEDYPWALTSAQWQTWLDQLVENWGGPVSLEYFAPSRALDRAFQQWWANLLRSSSSPGGVRAVIDVTREIDVRQILPALNVPTLVLHRLDDRMFRTGGARWMAAHIPGARYVELAGSDHLWWVGDTKAMLDEIGLFLDSIEHPAVVERVLTTLLVLELDTTQADDSILASCQQLFQAEVESFHGQVRMIEGSRCWATFNSPTRALTCGRGLLNKAAARHIPLHLATHTGEMELDIHHLQGPAIEITESILTTAPAGTLLVSGTVKDLVVGAGFHFLPAHEIMVPSLGMKLALYSLV
jgi:DNA-binding SARP family transcriptional activator/pimeloyl-ACP methyl ester carboxylesterase